MLIQLVIKNFVLVDHLDTAFKKGMTVLTGETGAGKSILIDALSFVLGEKSDTSIIRAGADRAEVSAVFDISTNKSAQKWLKEQDIDAEEGECLLRRTIDAEGRSKGYLNGRPALMGLLREFGDLLVDISGQHAHQLLLRAAVQRDMLDGQAGITELAGLVSDQYSGWQQAVKALADASQNAQHIQNEIETLQWEIEDMMPHLSAAQQWQEISEAHHRQANAEMLRESAQEAISRLSDDDYAISHQLSLLQRSMANMARYDEQAMRQMDSLLESANIAISELTRALAHYLDKIDTDPDAFVLLDQQVDGVLSVARKYRITPEEIPDRIQAAQKKLIELNRGHDIGALQASAEKAKVAYFLQAGKLSEKRQAAAKKLSKQVTQSLEKLGMAGAIFDIAAVKLEQPASYGLERVEFMLQANAGGTLRPLNKVASGGELSRIGLAISTVISQAASAPVLVFDEVDAGIGGRTGDVVGQMLHTLGRQYQVFCVTHLPQVAARADHQLQVSKAGGKTGQTHSHIQWLTDGERIEEIARMLSGAAVTEITLKHAKEMLESGLNL